MEIGVEGRSTIPLSELLDKARRVRLLVLDADGVLTDGHVIYLADGQEAKRFHVRDGTGLRIMLLTGFEVAIITGRISPSVRARAADLGIKHVAEGALDKIGALDRLLEELDLGEEETAFVADDLIDLPALGRVGLAVAVADAVSEVLGRAHLITSRPGGQGAVREVCDLILKAHGIYDKLLQGHRAQAWARLKP